MLRYLTAGESHGKGLTAILEGIPSHLKISENDINLELKRRQQGFGRSGRMKIETDKVEITSGLRHDETTGAPIALWIPNRDFKKNLDPVFVPRPGHADLAGALKYDQTDLRCVLERASARETAARVAVGAICKKLVREFGIDVAGHVINIGGVQISDDRPAFAIIKKRQENDPCRCIDSTVSKEMRKKILIAQQRGDSLGGVFEIIFTHLPVGLGSCTHWDRKLDGILAKTLLSIQGIKGVEFGLGFEMADLFGSDVHDEIFYDKNLESFSHRTNNAGGVEGGMTNGEDIVIRAVMKPIPTLAHPLMSVNLKTKRPERAAVHRADVCAVPAACVIAENCLCFDIANAVLDRFGGDSLTSNSPHPCISGVSPARPG